MRGSPRSTSNRRPSERGERRSIDRGPTLRRSRETQNSWLPDRGLTITERVRGSGQGRLPVAEVSAPVVSGTSAARRVLVDQLIHAARTVVLEPDELEEVSAEQTDMRPRELGHWRYGHDVCSELDPTVIVAAGPNVDLQPIYRAVKITGDAGDRLKAHGLELENCGTGSSTIVSAAPVSIIIR